MSTSFDYIQYIESRLPQNYYIRSKKMFGEYMVFIDEKPALLVCDNTVYVKQIDALSELLNQAEKGFPYQGAKEHYILDIDDMKLVSDVIEALLPHLKVRVKKSK